MSNALAVPTVTAAVTTLVQQAVDTVGLTPGPRVAPGTLEDSGDHGRVAVHLYRVSRNAAASNAVLPTRSSGGDLRARPTIALDLHYLLCFRADTDLDAQTMMAIAAVYLETNPVIGSELLDATEADHPEVGGNDLRSAPEPVRVSAESLSVDELTRLWALYTVGSFGLTLAVSAGPVLVEAPVTPAAGLPVRRLAVGARPLSGLRLDTVAGPGGPGAPVRAESPMPDLVLRGAGFRAGPGQTVDVLLDEAPVAPTATDDDQLTISSTGLAPGTHRLQVRRTGPPIDSTLSATPTVDVSETRLIQVVPALLSVSRTGDVLSATVRPGVTSGQRVRLLLDPTGPGGAPAALPPTSLGASPDTTVDFDVSDVPAGSYRLTFEVDGARSIPPVDAAGHYILTEVTL